MARRVRKTHKQKQRELETPEIIEESLWSLSDWMEQNWKMVVSVVGAFVLIWASIGLYQIMQDASNQDTAMLTQSAFDAASRGIYEPPADLEGKKDPNKPLGTTYSSEQARAKAVLAATAKKETEASGLIGVLAGDAQGTLGKLDAQLAAIDAVLPGLSGDPLELPLRQQRASALTGLKKFPEALAEWDKVVKLATTQQLKAEAQLHVGDLYNPNLSGAKADAAKAKVAYEAALKATLKGDKAPTDGALAFMHAEASTKIAGL